MARVLPGNSQDDGLRLSSSVVLPGQFHHSRTVPPFEDSEALIAAEPEYLISTFTSVAQAGDEKASLAIPGTAQTPAGRNGNPVVLDDTMIQPFGPRTGLSTEGNRQTAAGLIAAQASNR